VHRTVFALALAAALLPATATAAEPLSYRLQIVASPAGGQATDAQLARRLAVAEDGAGSMLRLNGGYVAQVRVHGDIHMRAAALRAAGAQIVDVSPEYNTVTVSAQRAELTAIAAADGIEAVTEELEPLVGAVEDARLNTCQGLTTSEGDIQLKAALARSDFELDGAGVEVGVLSDSYDTRPDSAVPAPAKHAAQDITSGDLPGAGNSCGRLAPVAVIDDFTSAAFTIWLRVRISRSRPPSRERCPSRTTSSR
jgi:hypothetical protein